MKYLIAISVLLAASSAFADEVEFDCSGDYKSKEAYDPLDPSTVSVHAHLQVTILGDGDTEFPVVKASLKMTTTNHKKEDAGSIRKRSGSAKTFDAHEEKYKKHVKLHMGSKPSPAYADTGNTPETYVLLPWSDEGSGDTAYVQRQGSGHDTYPTIKLDCQQ